MQTYSISSTYLRLIANDEQTRHYAENLIGDRLPELLMKDYVDGELVERIFESFEQDGETSLLMRFSHHLHMAAHGSLGFAVLTASNLLEAAKTLADYTCIRASNLSCDIEVTEDKATIRINNQVRKELAKKWFAEITLYSDKQLIGAIFGQDSSKEFQIQFEHARPPHHEELDRLFGVRCQYNQSTTALSFPASWCRMVSPLADEDAHRRNLLECRRLKLSLSCQHKDAVLATKLALENYFQTRWKGQSTQTNPPSLDEIAQLQYCSARTLARRLQDSDTSYKKLLEAERKNHSIYLLKNTHLSITDIADNLAYGEPANFVRAFKKWFGLTPTAWRKKLND